MVGTREAYLDRPSFYEEIDKSCPLELPNNTPQMFSFWSSKIRLICSTKLLERCLQFTTVGWSSNIRYISDSMVVEINSQQAKGLAHLRLFSSRVVLDLSSIEIIRYTCELSLYIPDSSSMTNDIILINYIYIIVSPRRRYNDR